MIVWEASSLPHPICRIPPTSSACAQAGCPYYLSLLIYTHYLLWVTIPVSGCRNSILGHSLSLLLFRNVTALASGRTLQVSCVLRACAYYLLQIGVPRGTKKILIILEAECVFPRRGGPSKEVMEITLSLHVATAQT